MLGSLKKTVKHSALYGFGNISSKLVGLILLPLYTANLSTSDYGILSIIEITSQLLIGLFTFSLPQAMLRWCATEKDSKKEKSIIFSTLLALIIIASIVVGVFLPLNKELSLLIFGNSVYSKYFSLLLIWSYLGIINRFPNSLLRLREKAVFYSVVMVSKFTIVLLANIYFVAVIQIGVEGIVWGQIIGEVFALAMVIPFIFRNLHFRIVFPVIREMFRYGFPLALSSISSSLLASGDRYVLTYYLSFASVGIYALAQKVGGVINVFLLHSFQQGFLPIAFKMFAEERPKRYFQKILTYFAFILTIAALGLSIFSEEIIKLFTEQQYYDAFYLVPFIAFAFVIKGINFVFTLGFHKVKKTSIYAGIIISGMLLTITLNIVLIPFLNVYGAAVSMVISYSIMASVTYIFAQKLFFIQYEIRKILKLISIAAGLTLIIFLLPTMNLVFSLAIKLIVFAAFPVILYFFNFYEEIELLRIKQSWIKWRNPLKWKDNLKQIKF